MLKKKAYVLVIAITFGAIGLVTAVLSHAATPTASVEPENGTLSSTLTMINDTTASGGKAVKFGSAQSGLPLLGAATYASTSGIHLGWADFESQMQGKLQIRRSYNNSSTIPSSFASSEAGVDVANTDVSMWSIKLDPVAFANGSYDAAFNTFLSSIPTGHQTYLCYWHEPEDDIQNGTVVGGHALTLANWQTAVNHMGVLIHAQHRTELHNQIILQGPWTFYSGGFGGTEYWDPGFDTSVDDIGMDIYANGVTGSAGLTNYAPIPNKLGYTAMMAWVNTHVVSQGKTWGMPEIGAHEEHLSSATPAQLATEAQDKATWITNSWAWAKANHLSYYLYFNFNSISSLPDDQSNIIRTGTPSETAFRAMVAEAD